MQYVGPGLVNPAGIDAFGLAANVLAKSTNYTAGAGDWCHYDTTSAARTLTLPATPGVGQAVRATDAAGTFGTNNLTVARNGQTIDGAASDFVMNGNWWDVLFVFTGVTWRVHGLTAFKRIQRGTITIGSSSTSNTATVTSVNMDRSELRMLGNTYSSSTNDLNKAFCYIALTNSTTITATRGVGAASNSVIVSYELVERW